MNSRVFLILSLSLTGLVLLTSPAVLTPLLQPAPSPTPTPSPTLTPTLTPTATPDPFSHIPTATPLQRDPVAWPSLPLPEGAQ